MFVFQDELPLICGVGVNRQLFAGKDDDDVEALQLLANDDDDDEGVGCCWPLEEDVPDELWPNICL